MTDIEHLIGKVGEAIDRVALDPTQWPSVLEAICESLPGTKATVHIADTRDHASIGVMHRGFDAGHMAEYEQHYAKLNPWVPLLIGAPALQALVSDERLPSWSFRETEFFQDWLARVGDMASTVGLKLVHEPDRIGVMAVHFAPRMGERYNRRVAHLLQCSAPRLRRAIDAVRLADKSAAAGPAPFSLGAFPLPAFLLDGHGRVLELNEPAQALVRGAVLSLGFDNALRFSQTALAERVLAVARQIAASHGPWSQGVDLPLTTVDGSRLTLSLLPVREPAAAGAPAFFAPIRRTLLLMRPFPGADTAASLDGRFGLTPAERRLALQLSRGLSLRQSADRLGIAYHTARSQLKAVFGKTGVSRQAELVALLVRTPGGERQD